ncbi:hypothetical protein [Bacillus tropicus]|uniref:hypothetical protein n=1 Tax=Bacillus tropicus TaxID=2026188 RepID=UPI00207AF213|nr:hypothetical protein [Bacillus tropicus]USK99698.1 hypothetical protein LIS81_27885 [Bacillus tropicus]
MKFRRRDEPEQYQVDNASRNAFMFYTVALLIWSLLDDYRTFHLGNEFLILSLGNAVYFTTLVVQNRKVNRFAEESIEGNKLRQFIKQKKI